MGKLPVWIGVDPGKSGAIAILDPSGPLEVIRLDGTWHDISDALAEWRGAALAVIERVSAMPRQGVASTFKFGCSYGFCLGILCAHQIPWRDVTPRVWQRSLRCLSQGNKNVTKAAAQQRWPKQRITHRTADALLLAEYARLAWLAENRLAVTKWGDD